MVILYPRENLTGFCWNFSISPWPMTTSYSKHTVPWNPEVGDEARYSVQFLDIHIANMPWARKQTQQLYAGQIQRRVPGFSLFLACTWGSFSSYLDNHQQQPGKRSIGCLIWKMSTLTNVSSLPSAELKCMLKLHADPGEHDSELWTFHMD